MKNLSAGTLIPGVLALAGVAGLVFCAGVGPARPLEARVPGLDRPKPAGEKVDIRPLVGKLTRYDGVAINLPGSWSRFRGERFDGIAEPGVPLARQWPATGPPVLWSIELGEGHAGAAVWDGRVFVLDYDRPAAADAVRCLSLADGREIWRFSYPVEVKRNHGMSRTVPAVTDKYLVALGPKCHVSCLDPATGKAYWLDGLGVQLRRHRAAVVRRAVPLDRPGPGDPGHGRRRAAGGARLPNRPGGLEKPQPPRLDHDPLFDHAHGIRRPADVRLLRQRGRGRGLGRRRLDPLGHHRLEDQHRHRPFAGDPARGPHLPLRRIQHRAR